jgi:endonuclease/exonuclease/phosphatase family metal-dependent hydrolase
VGFGNGSRFRSRLFSQALPDALARMLSPRRRFRLAFALMVALLSLRMAGAALLADDLERLRASWENHAITREVRLLPRRWSSFSPDLFAPWDDATAAAATTSVSVEHDAVDADTGDGGGDHAAARGPAANEDAESATAAAAAAAAPAEESVRDGESGGSAVEPDWDRIARRLALSRVAARAESWLRAANETRDRPFRLVAAEAAEQYLRQFAGMRVPGQPEFHDWNSPLTTRFRLEYEEEESLADAAKCALRHVLWLTRAFSVLGPLPKKVAQMNDITLERLSGILDDYDRIHVVSHYSLCAAARAIVSEHDASTSTFEELHASSLPAEDPAVANSAEHRDHLGHSAPPAFRIMAYNIWNVNEWGPEAARASGRPRDRKDVIANQIADAAADILLLQEVRFVNRVFDLPRGSQHQMEQLVDQLQGNDSGGERLDFVFQAAHTDVALRHGAYGQVLLGIQEDEGVAVVSRHPIVASHFLALSRNMTDGEDAHQRVILHARVLVGGRVEHDQDRRPFLVDVYTTHLGLSPVGRRRNVVEMEQFISETNMEVDGLTARPPVVLAGDFNAECFEESLRWLMREGRFRDSQGALAGREDACTAKPLTPEQVDPLTPGQARYPEHVLETDAWTFSALPNATHKVIDFVLYRPGSMDFQTVSGGPVENPAGRAPSDHRALVFDFEVKRTV